MTPAPTQQPPATITGHTPRSDGRMLHVDFEAWADGVVGPLNAGVRWVGHPFSTSVKQNVVEITNDHCCAYGGRRAAHVSTNSADQQGRIAVQRRADVPPIFSAIAEFVFRPVVSDPVDMDEFVLWSCSDPSGSPIGITLLARGLASEGTYCIDVEAGAGERHSAVIAGLGQQKWIRIILDRRTTDGVVDLWAGPPDSEQFMGSFKDSDPEAELYLIEFGDLSPMQGIGSGYWDDIRIGGRLADGANVAAPETWQPLNAEVIQPTAPLAVSGERQLFVDDWVVESMHDLRRHYHTVTKHPANPVLKPETPCELQTNCVLPQAVLRVGESGNFRCWYGIWGVQVKKPTYMAIADSGDGIRWTRPNLELLEFQGSRQNNLIREGRQFRVLYDPHDEDPQRRYKAIIRDAGFLAGFSPDGLRWTTTTPVLDQAYDASSVHWDPVNRHWIASCKIWKDGKRARGYAQSSDFLHWSDTRFMFAADELDGADDQTYSLTIIRYESVYVGLLKMYHLDSDRCDIQVAFSRDAKQWDRSNRSPFIPNGEVASDWDYGNLDPTSAIHRMGDELLFFYSGRRALHNEVPNDGAMGMARLRRDGFVSVDAGEEVGVLVTRPLILKGKRLHMNARADGGEIRVEILEGHKQSITADEADVPIYPFTKGNVMPISTDSTCHQVTWKTNAGLQALRGRPVRLRFTMKRAELYSFWVE